eukprot:NODE_319_length_9908_cov_1.288001.p4 type:complete len:361 gc:universal NODE_319_length_9908_cov_1.288001:5653-4571(-)
MMDESVTLFLSFLIYILVQIQPLSLNFAVIPFDKRVKYYRLKLEVQNLDLSYNNCDHIFNPSFILNMVAFRCYVGEEVINQGVYHLHKIQLNINTNTQKNFLLAGKEYYRIVDMAYTNPIDAIELRRGSALGWSWIGAEDVRPFMLNGIAYLAYTAPSGKMQTQYLRSIFIICLEDAKSNRDTAVEITNTMKFKRSNEKHWAFINESGSESLFAIYQLEPFTVGEVIDSQLVFSYTKDYTCLEAYGTASINLATNAIKLKLKRDLILLVYNVKDSGYDPFILFLESRHPFVPIMRSKYPLELRSHNGDFVYVNSIATESGLLEAGPDDVLIFGAGIGDFETAFIRIKVSEILKIEYEQCI